MINLQTITKKIKGDNPCGRNLRDDDAFDSLYHQLKDARNQARTIERQLNEEASEQDALTEWQTVLELATRLLQEETKDLEIAAYLTESLLRLDGLHGLTQGFQVIHDLSAKYWEQLYPYDENDVEEKIAPLVSLNGENVDGTLIQPITNIAITDGSKSTVFRLWQYQYALSGKAQVDDENYVDVKEIVQAGIESGVKFYQQLNTDLSACLTTFKQLTDLLNEKCGHNAPPSSTIQSALINLKDHLGFLKATMNDISPEQIIEATIPEEIPQTEITPNIVVQSTSIQTRDEALKMMASAAAFFTSQEPQSPIPFILKRAIRWASLSLPDLLAELIADEKTRCDLTSQIGVDFLTKQEA